ncbi:6785_t:CDS:2 [Acaulospora morrowiae]|uniref:6785_t:CDS:1 n=1 Tax=Acaulospora morrowiae TaxID=94023 RepID=A0A9N9CNU8_9GLOM|nr:6785_t:CDS:2 [Acaulospora morrowiae]
MILAIAYRPDFELVQMMVDACLNRNEMTTARLLSKHTRTSNLGCIYGQANLIIRKNIQTNAINVLSRSYLTDVLTLYNESKFLGYFRKDLYIHNFVARILVNNERIEQAQEVLLDIQRLGLTPNVDTYKIMIHFAKVQKNSKNVMQVFQEIRRKKFTVDHVTLLYLIRCLCAARDFEGSKMVIDLMQRSNMKLNINHYNALMKAYGSGRDKNVQTELNIIDSNNDPSNKYCMIRTAYQTTLKSRMYCAYFNVIRNSNLFPNADAFHIIIEIFAKAGNFEMAKNSIRQ